MIGEVLREKRLLKDIPLEKVSLDLKIKTSFLKALEEENFEIFPADVYTIGYLRAYALYLGLDPEPLIEKFKTLRKKHTEEVSQVETRSGSEESITKVTPGQGLKTGLFKQSKPHFLILIVIFLIVGVVMGSVFKTCKVSNIPEQKQQIGLPAPPQPQVHPEVQKEIKSIKPQEPQLEKAEVYTLKITAHELTWLKVESEEGVHDITMKPGDRVTYTSRKGFKVITGNAGGISLTLNEKDMGSPGKSGEVKVISLP